MAVKRGVLIAFEGLDRSGKSTQTQLLLNSLNQNGINAKLIKFPDRTTSIGKAIDQYLNNTTDVNDHTIHLLFSANRWETVDAIKNDLDAGLTLIMDRYAFSGVAYSAAKGMDINWCKCPDKGLPKPDLVFYLDLDPSVASEREDYGFERYEEKNFQHKVREMFMKIKEPYWQVIDASQNKDDIHKAVYSSVEQAVLSVQESPVELLWV